MYVYIYIYMYMTTSKGYAFGGTIPLESLHETTMNIPRIITSARTCSVILGLAVIARSPAGRSPPPLAVTVRSSALTWPPRPLGSALGGIRMWSFGFGVGAFGFRARKV